MFKYIEFLIKIICLFFLIIFSIIPFFILSILIKIDSKGPIIHWSKRVGKNNKIFLMPKFRTMKIETPQLATHLLNDSKDLFG